MKFMAFSLVLLLVAFYNVANAADCEFGDKQLKIGEEFTKPGECSIYSCAGKGSITAKTCPESNAPPSCKLIPQDNSKPWPKCCKRYEC